jgi:two-component sensor histidine kinase
MPISSRFVIQSTVILLAVGFVTLVAIVGMTIWLGEQAQLYSSISDRMRDTRINAVELRSALQSAESSQRGFLVSGNEIYLAPFDNAKVSTQQYLGRLQKSFEDDTAAAPMIQRLSAVVAEKIAEMDRSITLRRESRHDEAMAIFATNRGKALMDESNVFLSSIIRNADEQLIAATGEQKENAARLRWVSIVGGTLIVLVVAGVTATTLRYSYEIATARDQVKVLNATLERRVETRTAELSRARDRAEMLLSEVNHRVANSLMMVASLVKLQSNATADKTAKNALSETESRIRAISEVHKRLYSSGDVRSIALDEYLRQLLQHLEISMRAEGYGASLRVSLEPCNLNTDASVNLGVVLNEWVTNAFKYAYPQGHGEVRVILKSDGNGTGELRVEDDGVGRTAAPAQGSGLGTRLVTAMASNMAAEVRYSDRPPGTVASLIFPIAPA